MYCYDRRPQGWQYFKSRYKFITVSEAGKCSIKVWQLVRALQLPHSTVVYQKPEGQGRDSFVDPFADPPDLIPSCEAAPSTAVEADCHHSLDIGEGRIQNHGRMVQRFASESCGHLISMVCVENPCHTLYISISLIKH
jgi:hypothetical protein